MWEEHGQPLGLSKGDPHQPSDAQITQIAVRRATMRGTDEHALDIEAVELKGMLAMGSKDKESRRSEGEPANMAAAMVLDAVVAKKHSRRGAESPAAAPWLPGEQTREEARCSSRSGSVSSGADGVGTGTRKARRAPGSRGGGGAATYLDESTTPRWCWSRLRAEPRGVEPRGCNGQRQPVDLSANQNVRGLTGQARAYDNTLRRTATPDGYVRPAAKQ